MLGISALVAFINIFTQSLQQAFMFSNLLALNVVAFLGVGIDTREQHPERFDRRAQIASQSPHAL